MPFINPTSTAANMSDRILLIFNLMFKNSNTPTPITSDMSGKCSPKNDKFVFPQSLKNDESEFTITHYKLFIAK